MSLTLLGAIAWASLALAEGSSDARWWRKIDGEWCLSYKQRGFCLPLDYEARGFDSSNAEFGIDSVGKPISLITYESGTAQDDIDILLSDSDDPLWQLSASQLIGDVVVTRIEPQESKREDAHGVVLSILEFGGFFTLTINSSDRTTHSVLVESLTAQWLGKTKN
tara:strand:- start:372 stop:866 length:495 start_codon:yes stop_codon:yes gene_type:complete